MIEGSPGWTCALVGWCIGRTAMWEGLFTPPSARWNVRRSTYGGFLLASGVGIGLWASSDGDAAFLQRTGSVFVVLLAALLGVGACLGGGRRRSLATVAGLAGIAALPTFVDARAATAFGDVGAGMRAIDVAPWVGLGFGVLLFAAVPRPPGRGLGRLAVAFGLAVLEWTWVSRHLWLPESCGWPDRVDVAAMSETLRFPFLAAWSGLGHAGMIGLLLVGRDSTEST